MSAFNYRGARDGICITNWQPDATPVLGSEESITTVSVEEISLQHRYDEEHYRWEWHDQTSSAHGRCWHNTIRLRKFILPALLAVLVVLGGLLAWSCVNWHGWSNLGVDSLERRAVNLTPFKDWVHNKLGSMGYFVSIVIAVVAVALLLGIVLVVVFRPEAFEDSRCCPCYVFATVCGIRTGRVVAADLTGRSSKGRLGQ